MKNIFGSTENNIPKILRSLGDIQIIENDGLPAQICSLCLQEANSACYFRMKCQESDKLLRKGLKRSEFVVQVKDEELQDNNFDDLFDT
ncbi:hypothetical protein Bhyg_14386, partial [Pseudolycoriella hygida]